MNATQFWTWFQDNEQKLYILPLLSTDEQEEYLYWLQTHLDYYCEGFDFKINPCKTYTTPATLAILTDDEPDLKYFALELVQAAPPMDNWTVVTYHRRKEEITEEKTVGPSNFKLKVNQLYFQPVFKINDNTKITINIFTTKKVSYAKRKQFKKLCTQILTDMVGGEILEQHIGFIRCNLKSHFPGVAIKIIHFHQFIKCLKQVYK